MKMNVEVLRDGIVLSPPDSAEGWLDGYELGARKCRAALLTASCCGSGLAGSFAGRELASFGYAVQISGIPAVVVAQWPVQDDEAAAFMTAFHEAFSQGNSVGQAMRTAAKAPGVGQAKDTFVVIGDPSVRRPSG